MYDPKKEAKEFIADNAQEAIAAAVTFFGLSESQLKVITLGSDAVSGLGGRTLVIARANNGRSRAGKEPSYDVTPAGEEKNTESAAEPQIELAEEENREPSVGTVKGEVSETGDFLKGVVERLDAGPFEIEQNEEKDLVIFNLSGPASARIGSGDGRAADALQLLVNQAAYSFEEDPKRIVVDTEGDTEEREDLLTRAAGRAAKRALDTGRPVALEAMNPRDRRLVHIALRDNEEVATLSNGEGRYRKVIVVPKGTPDFEEARKASKERND
tara:strand:- start:4094 stop:4906 length:813 start_codon:yes stop_codon:yes gene_type:complete